MKELEAIIWCKVCRVDKYEVYRSQVGDTMVFENSTDPLNSTAKHCETCGQLLERKP